MRNRDKALTTGQAASYCFVTSDTIVNWIKGDRLTARRTAGGQYRILIKDLRAFMILRGMKTDVLDDAFEARRYCWETFGAGLSCPIEGVDCEGCLVFRSRARSCFELRCALATDREQLEGCEDCPYLESWRCEGVTAPLRTRAPLRCYRPEARSEENHGR